LDGNCNDSQTPYEKYRATHYRYNHSPEGQERYQRYAKSAKRRAAVLRYIHSAGRKMTQKIWRMNHPEDKLRQRLAWQARYLYGTGQEKHIA